MLKREESKKRENSRKTDQTFSSPPFPYILAGFPLLPTFGSTIDASLTASFQFK